MAKRGRPRKEQADIEQVSEEEMAPEDWKPVWLHSLKGGKLFTEKAHAQAALESGEWARDYGDLIKEPSK